MHPAIHAKTFPDKPAIIVAETGEIITYATLDQRSNQGAHLFRQAGLNPGDVVGLFMINDPVFLEAAWAAQRSGLLFTCISTKSSPSELEYILQDSGTKLLIASHSLANIARRATAGLPHIKLYIAGQPQADSDSFEAVRASLPTSPVADECAGVDLLYSSGTTGRPKGVKPKLVPGEPITTPHRVAELAQSRFGFNENNVYLTPAPLYHAAPLRWSMAVHRIGGTIILMRKFDPIMALEVIQRYRVDVSQWVPTHFVRFLKLDAAERERFDISSLKVAIHAAAPCPATIKEAMMDWWGPILHEYYGGTEGIGMTAISPQEWLEKRGSVGRAISGKVHICDDDGEPVETGTTGLVYFSDGPKFEYHNDLKKTAESYNSKGWATFGDVGYLDEDGYLFLTDRKSFMVISGGVNIYPQEIENHLITHPKVADVAVIGAPDEEMGERVVAVVQPTDMREAGPELAAELTEYVRAHLSHVKTPRQVDFMENLPRLENGKLYKRLIRDQYWPKKTEAA